MTAGGVYQVARVPDQIGHLDGPPITRAQRSHRAIRNRFLEAVTKDSLRGFILSYKYRTWESLR